MYVYHSGATLPFRTAMAGKEGMWLTHVLAESFGTPPIRIRMMGGTVPITDMINTLNVPAIILPMVNADNNQHSPNENMRLGHLFNAVKIFHAIFTHPITMP